MCSIFVLMLNGSPISAKLPDDPGFGERFWYWRGFSGQSFIHSIYSGGNCPPLPGAVFVAVSRKDCSRKALAVGRFPAVIEGSSFDVRRQVPESEGADEIHVHLLARDSDSAERVRRDLEAALNHEPSAAPPIERQPYRKPVQLVLIAA